MYVSMCVSTLVNMFNRPQDRKMPRIHVISFKIQLDSNRAGSYFTRGFSKKQRTINKILLTQTPKPEDLSRKFSRIGGHTSCKATCHRAGWYCA